MTGHSIIARIPKNRRSEIRVSLSNFNGSDVAHIRLWAQVGDDFVPTPKGVCLQPEQLPLLQAAIEKAIVETQRRGLRAAKAAWRGRFSANPEGHA